MYDFEPPFRNSFSKDIFNYKYRHEGAETWGELAQTLAKDVCRDFIPGDMRDEIAKAIAEMKFIPGGRYLYYAGRPLKAFQNCYSLKGIFDSREDWADLSWKAESCLSTGGGIGVDYSVYRPRNSRLSRTGGVASGPVSKMRMINEIGREVIQGGSRRAAMYASLSWSHPDAKEFLHAKDWDRMEVGKTGYTFAQVKEMDFNFPCPLDMTNISLNYDDAFLNELASDTIPATFLENCRQTLEYGDPGFSFNFGKYAEETGRNACVTGDTLILTYEGHVPIKNRIGVRVDIWNGEDWSKVVPFETGWRKIYRVRLSDGSYLDCTDDHKWILKGGGRVETKDLEKGDRLEKFPMPVVTNGFIKYEGDAYSQGFYSGDGTTDRVRSNVFEPKFVCIPRLVGTFSAEKAYNSCPFVVWTHGEMKDKSFVPVHADLKYCLEWLAGLLDSDGTVTRDTNGNGFQIGSVDKEFLLNVKIMLSRMGVRAKVVKGNPEGYRSMPDGNGGYQDYFCQSLHRLLIGNTDTHHLIQLGLKTSRLDVHGLPPQRDARRFVQVESVEFLNEQETYCFTEPLANRGTFNGIVTGQCTEFTTKDDSDCCNLGSINFSRIETREELERITYLAGIFLLCGSIVSDVPYPKIKQVRDKNRRIGLGIMGIHEWLIQRGYRYEMNPEFKEWLRTWKEASEKGAKEYAEKLSVSTPTAFRAIAPTGTIGIMAGTTTGIEPIFAVSYKRRYLKNGTEWVYQYVIDSAAQSLIDLYGTDPDKIESSLDLARDYERRIKFQADVQDFVDMGISSTINLPEWGTDGNNEDKVVEFAKVLSTYAPRLRGFTGYPDGARGGQPLTVVPYHEAHNQTGVEFKEHDSCKGGVCGI